MKKILTYLGWVPPEDFEEEEINLLFELLLKHQLSYDESIKLIEILRVTE